MHRTFSAWCVYVDAFSEWKSWHVSFSAHTLRRGKCIKKCPSTQVNFRVAENAQWKCLSVNEALVPYHSQFFIIANLAQLQKNTGPSIVVVWCVLALTHWDDVKLMEYIRSGVAAFAGAARRRVHLATVLPRPLSGHSPGRRQAAMPASFR